MTRLQEQFSLVSFPEHHVTQILLSSSDLIVADSDKSIGQQASDAVGGSSKPGEKGYVEQAQQVLGDAATTVQNTANGAYKIKQ